MLPVSLLLLLLLWIGKNTGHGFQAAPAVQLRPHHSAEIPVSSSSSSSSSLIATTCTTSCRQLRANHHRDSDYSNDSSHDTADDCTVEDNNKNSNRYYSSHRRNMLAALGASHLVWGGGNNQHNNIAHAANPFSRFALSQPSSGLLVVGPGKNATQALQRGPFVPALEALGSELCLLKLLPVNNPLFRQLESRLEGLSALQNPTRESGAWEKARNSTESAIENLDKRRQQLEPVFNPEDSTLLQITKGERSERLIENLRSCMLDIVEATKQRNVTLSFETQKRALLALSEVGELLVENFPYDVPTDGRYSYLPRLLGRARVTLSFSRNNRKQFLGNITMVADGFLAPLSAGNFVDLCIRNFYGGLAVKFAKKRLGMGADFDVANLPILGSFQDGFFDPLTAKLRRIPLEIVRVEKTSSVPVLSYSQGLANLFGKASLEPSVNKLPLLSFASVPGLVAMNHPEKNANGASSEFFGLQADSVLDRDKGALLDGEYAPFGYIIDGMDVFQNLKPNDILEATVVDEYGQLNLAKVRQSSFSEVVQGTGS